MKNYKKIGLACMVLLAVCSCTDDELEFRVDKPENIAFMEYLNQYDDLKTYIDRTTSPNFKLGAGIGMDEYSDKGVMYRLVNRNFDEVVVGTEMSHGAVVQSDGSLNVMNFSLLLDDVQESGLSLFGHTLGWHINQNGDYLNGLIAPIIIPNEVDNNLLDIEALRNGIYTGWGGSANYSTVEGMGMPDDNPGPAVRLIVSPTAEFAWDGNWTSPRIPAEAGKTYKVSFYIRSEGAGEGRLSFSEDVVAQYVPSFQTGSSWQEIVYTFDDVKEGSTSFGLNFDMGFVAGMTYYIDLNSLAVIEVNEDDVVLEENLIPNGDFEDGTITGWGGWGDLTCSISDLGEGHGNEGYALRVINHEAKGAGNAWQTQFTWTFEELLEVGATYHVKFDVRAASDDGVFDISVQSSGDYSSNPGPKVNVGTEWETVTWIVSPTVARDRFLFTVGEVATTYYFDNFSFAKEDPTGGAGVTIIEKTDEEKAELIGEAFETWIEGMLTACKEYVTAWDVVNEPMSDSNPYELRTGGSTQTADEFYWQDYLGKDYGVTAFKLARKYGNESDLLFINDNNLEYNLNKCRGLIEYVDYIEKQGGRVDGIGTQMHLTIYDSKENIATMFELLAATGKLIKVSELEVTLSVENPTDDDYKAQADMYRYVVDIYKEKIPVSQQYGITLWSVVDTDAGKYPGLWNREYNRKRSYAGVANGLAGKTVYEEFEFSEETEE